MRHLKGTIGIAVSAFLFASLIWVLENYCITDQSARAYQLRFQFFTSSWPAEWPSVISRTSAMFALGVLVRSVLVVGPLVVVVRILWGIFAIERREEMNQIRLLDALRTL